MITVEDVKRLLFEATPGPWYPQDFTPPEVNDAPTAGDVYVSATWPDHIGVASMCGGFMGPQGLVQARADAEAIATWPKLARAYIDTAAALEKMTAERDAETARADAAEAVVKGLREQGLEFPDGWRDMAHDAHNGPGLKAQRTWSAGFNAARDALDAALASVDGLAMVQELQERAEKAEAGEDKWMNRCMDEVGEHLTTKAERDTLAAENTSLKAREVVLVGAPERLWLWPEDPEDGVGKWVSFPDQPYPGGSTEYLRADIARALAQTPTDPGDGWTWNERLGWIGPDGKPAARGK